MVAVCFQARAGNETGRVLCCLGQQSAALRRDYRRATKKHASTRPFPLISTMPRGSKT